MHYYNFTLTEGRLVRLKNGFFIYFLIKISLLFYFPDKSTLHTIHMLIHYTCIQVSSFQKTQLKFFSTLCNNKQKRHYTQYNSFLFFWSSSSKEQHPQNFPICPCTLTSLSSDLGTSLPRAKHNIGFSWLQMLKLFIFFANECCFRFRLVQFHLPEEGCLTLRQVLICWERQCLLIKTTIKHLLTKTIHWH